MIKATYLIFYCFLFDNSKGSDKVHPNLRWSPTQQAILHVSWLVKSVDAAITCFVDEMVLGFLFVFVKKKGLCCMQTTNAQISLRIRAV